jgi:hypothetical protein
VSADVTPFQRARLAAAQPLTAACPTIQVGVTPDLIAALEAGLQATTHDITKAQRFELQSVLVKLKLAQARRVLLS